MASDSDAAGTSNNILNSSVSFPGENGHRSAIAQRLRRNKRNRGAANVARQRSEPGSGQQSIRYCSDPCKAAILQQHLPVDNTPPPPYSQADPTVATHGGVEPNPRDLIQGSAAANPVVGRGNVVSPRVQSQEIPLRPPRFPVERKPLLGQEDYLQPAGQHSTTYDDLLNSASGVFLTPAQDYILENVVIFMLCLCFAFYVWTHPQLDKGICTHTHTYACARCDCLMWFLSIEMHCKY